MNKNKTEEKHYKESVKTILHNFKTNISGVEYYFNKFGGLAQDEDAIENQKSGEYIRERLREIGIHINEKTKDTDTFRVSAEKLNALSQSLREQKLISRVNYDILSKSTFLMLNNYFEYLLSDLLAYHYNKFQKSLNEKTFTITLKEINEFEFIEEFTNFLITKEVESMMVELSFNELLTHFQKKLEINTESEIVNWDIIIEARERRHLIVHNSSVVNKKYITRTKNPFGLKLNDTVEIDNKYFFQCCKEFLLAGLLMSYNSWGKWDKENTTDAIKEIMMDSFEFLKQEEYTLASKFTSYLPRIETRTDEQDSFLMKAKFNRLIALKKLQKKDDLSKELKKIKVGTASPIFKLAYSILTDKYENIIDLIKQSKAVNELDITKYRDWPIYDFIRNDEQLNSKIEQELN